MRPKWNTEHLEAFIDEMEAEPHVWKKVLSYGLLALALGTFFWWKMDKVPIGVVVFALIAGEKLGAFAAKKEFVKKLEKDRVDLD